ncbi:MAG TPA: 50S ribosomal protein L9 [Acidobacteriota bacterium]|nr:50S ribosomal protein L9 [Acidobacteriota bacterium]
MQVILTEDVYELGNRGEVVEVAKGYGRNYLIPNHLAIPATPGNLKIVEQQQKALAKKETKHREEAELLAKELNDLHLVVSRKAGESGSLFGSVTAKDIVNLLKREGITLDRRKLVIEQPLKSIGNYKMEARLFPEIEAYLLISVVAEGDMPVSKVKRKDAETDQIVREINEKVRDLNLPNEDDLVIDERFGPEPEGEDAEEAPAEVSARAKPDPEIEVRTESSTADSAQEEEAAEEQAGETAETQEEPEAKS